MTFSRVPDAVLIKKSYDFTKRQHHRNRKLKELARDRENMGTDDEGQQQDSREDLEYDEAIRKNVSIYRDSTIPLEGDRVMKEHLELVWLRCLTFTFLKTQLVTKVGL